jgi:hypothetical protein
MCSVFQLVSRDGSRHGSVSSQRRDHTRAMLTDREGISCPGCPVGESPKKLAAHPHGRRAVRASPLIAVTRQPSWPGWESPCRASPNFPMPLGESDRPIAVAFLFSPEQSRLRHGRPRLLSRGSISVAVDRDKAINRLVGDCR